MTKKRAATKRWEDALERRVALSAEIEQLREQLVGLEQAERAALRDRAPLEAIKDARQSVEVGRLQLEHAQGELAELDSSIPALEAAMEHNDLVNEMSTAAREALEAEGRVREILRGILEREGEALSELSAAHESLDGAVMRYETLGRSAVPGTTYSGESNWLHPSEKKSSLEGEIQRGGVSLKSVKGDLDPEQPDMLYRLVWGVYAEIRGRSRAARRLAEEEAFRREQAEREEARQERNRAFFGFSGF